MSNTFGTNVKITLFGESHGETIGAVLDGMPAGVSVDGEFIAAQLTKRRPSGKTATPRVEKDEYKIVSGVFNGKTTGAPITVLIPNTDTRSKDYTYGPARPSHADYTAHVKYGGHEDFRGGGHFSGRLTAPITAAGAIAISALMQRGIKIETKVLGVDEKRILDAAARGDSVGGILETTVTGVPVGLGEPWFDSVESLLAHAMFSIPAVKGVEFGAGFELAKMYGSQANDPFYCEDGKVYTRTNNNGGINGGITNGMPIVMRTVIKPTPTIAAKQQTVDFLTGENITFTARGRHDPCIVPRAAVVADSLCALVLCDLLIGGRAWNTDV